MLRGHTLNETRNDGRRVARKTLAIILVVGIVALVALVSRERGITSANPETQTMLAKPDPSVSPSHSGYDFATQARATAAFSRDKTQSDVGSSLSLSVTLAKRETPVFKTGDNIEIRFSATNTGLNRIKFSKFGLPLSTLMTGSDTNTDEQLVRRGMMHLTYENCRSSECEEKWMGPTVLTHPAACNDEDESSQCVSLEPGQTVSLEFNLAKYFTLPRSGAYHVQVGGRLHPFSSLLTSNKLSFHFTVMEGNNRVPTAMEIVALDKTQAVADVARHHAFAVKENGLTVGTITRTEKFGLGAKIEFDITTASSGRLEITMNGLVTLKFEGNTLSVGQSGTDSGPVSIAFSGYASVFGDGKSHHVSLKVGAEGYTVLVDGKCAPGNDGPVIFNCPMNVLSVVDDSPSTQKGKPIVLVVSHVSGGTRATYLRVTGGKIVMNKRRLGVGCGTVSVPLSYTSCTDTATIQTSVEKASEGIKAKNLHNTVLFPGVTDWTEVDSIFSAMSDALCQTQTPITSLRFYCRSDCPGDYAYVYGGQRNALTIFLCELYFSAPMSGRNSKLGTVVHELSHFDQIGYTEDLAYGCWASKHLTSAESQWNADTYAYVVEDSCP